MTETIHVRRIKTLLDLKSAVTRFAEDTQHQVPRLRILIGRRLEAVTAAVLEKHRLVGRLEVEVREERRALGECESQPVEEDEPRPDCSAEREALRDAQDALSNARYELEEVLGWQRILRSQAESVESRLRRLDELSTAGATAASTYLGSAHRRLLDYVRVKPDASLPDLVRLFEARASGNVPPLGVGAGPPEPHPFQLSVDLPAVSGATRQQNNVVFVDVADLPMPDGIEGPGSFKKVSMAEMTEGLRRLQEMTPGLLDGYGKDDSYWHKLDEQLRRPFSKSYQRIFEVFYGEDRIRVEITDSRYTIINGRHRIWLAKALGLRRIPIDLVDHSLPPDGKQNAG